MLKMKKLICSLVIASAGLFIYATSSDAARISFTPPGSDFDGDGVNDILASPGDVIDFQVLFDTNNITTNPRLLNGVDIFFQISCFAFKL